MLTPQQKAYIMFLLYNIEECVMTTNCNNYEQFEAELPILFSKITKSFNRNYGDFLKPYGLSKLHAFYLLCLLKNSHGIKVKQICDELGCDKANTSRALADLESKGIISKSSQNDNEKKYDIKLTDKGFNIAKNFEKSVKENVGIMLSVLNQEDVNYLTNIIRKLSDNIGEESYDTN